MNKRAKINENTTTRLKVLVNKIDNPEIRNIVEQVLNVEISYRSSDRQNFPMKNIRDIINNSALVKQIR
ncbi:hypothetical protein [Pedobacter psychroterrae]|uniref:Uncharacterized protein n=1 Tax=Pedobacter psychroterrae TaxID=2530453 RepID=A0A4R0NM14_9SPHI|nr:hypothetical protein [Pedobacter psychroterrae]TCD01229.1 hypothetical protein EZ437_10760 [Pedobacter psychroterrae]